MFCDNGRYLLYILQKAGSCQNFRKVSDVVDLNIDVGEEIM